MSGRSRCSRPPAAPGLPPRPRSPGLRARVCRSGWRADLDFARRGSSPPPTRVRRQRRLPLRRGRGPGPAGELPQARWLCRPRRHQRVALAARGARVSAAAHPGELPGARSAAPAAADKPPDASPGRPLARKRDCHTLPTLTSPLKHSSEAVFTGSTTRRSENTVRAARPSLVHPPL